MNDLPSVTKEYETESYVDDTKIYLSVQPIDLENGILRVAVDLNRIAEWCSLLAGGRRCFYRGKLPVQLLPPPPSRGQKSKMATAIAGLGVFRDKNTDYRLQAG